MRRTFGNILVEMKRCLKLFFKCNIDRLRGDKSNRDTTQRDGGRLGEAILSVDIRSTTVSMPAVLLK